MNGDGQHVQQGVAVAGPVEGGVQVYQLPGALQFGPDGGTDAIVGGPLSAGDIARARAGFVAPDWFTDAVQYLATSGVVVVLSGPPRTGRRTAALNLLATVAPDASEIHVLDGDNDFVQWRPERHGPRGYLVWGDLSGCLFKPGALASICSRLRHGRSSLVVILPQSESDGAGRAAGSGLLLVRHVPPSAERIVMERLTPTLPDRNQRLRAVAGLRDLLTPDACPQDAVDLATAVQQSAGPDRVTDARRLVRQRARQDATSLLIKVKDDPRSQAVLVAAGVYHGLGQAAVERQADRLWAGQIHDGLPPSAGASPSFIELLGNVGAYVVTPECRVRFHRCRRPDAVLQQLGGMPEEYVRSVVDWLTRIDRRPELIARAGRALALIAGPECDARGFRRIRSAAASRDSASRSVAAAAMRHLTAEPATVVLCRDRLHVWAATDARWLRCTVALTCADGSSVAPVDVALPVLRELARSLATTPDAYAARLLDRALIGLFRSGRERAVLRELSDWAEENGPEGRDSARLLALLLDENIPWFERHLLDERVCRLAAQVISHALQARAPSDALLAALLAWGRCARWDAGRAEPLDALLRAVGADRHPAVDHFLSRVTRDGRSSPSRSVDAAFRKQTTARRNNRRGGPSWD